MGVEDSMAGIEALSAAGFGLIIGIERRGDGRALIERGATFVVRDLADLRLRSKDPPPVVRATAGERRALTSGIDLPACPISDAAWKLVEEGFVLSREHEIESLFAIGNGFVGTRASLAEGSALSAPATFLAGLFDQRPEATPGLVALPDWTRLSVVLEGEPIRLDVGRNLEHRRILDMRQGILWREWRHQDAAGRITRLRGLRLASLADRRLLIQSVALSAENYSGTVSIDVGLGESVSRPTHCGATVALAAATRLRGVESPETGSAMPSQSFEVELGKTYRLDRVVAVCTSSDTDHPLDRAREQAERAMATGLERLIDEHRSAWLERWMICDIAIDGDPAAQHALRFAAYHLVSAANPEDGRVSIGARGLTGEAYRGHVFWDTEIFMLPFFNLTWPEAAKALLSYRHHTLDAARRRAARLGYRGALYAWESADTGEDVTPPLVVAPTGEVVKILVGEQEQHISADIAYAVWSYWEATHDEQFLVDAGAEIIFETARFWASRARHETDGRYHIRNVIGPDEYHETVDDNAYTNGMAQWTLETGERLARLFAERWPSNWRALSDRLHLAPQEPAEWLSLACDLYTGFDARTGLIEQFQGYFTLEDIDLTAYEPRNVPMDVLLGRERIQGSKIIKQADVVMLLYLLWDRFPPAVREVNFRYYEPRCGHGSSLSPAIHAAVAARLGDGALAERYFRQAMDIDLANNMGNAAGGVHLAALGGLWQAAVFGFAGLRLAGERPEHHPKLPPQWRGLSMRFKWRGEEHELKLPFEQPTLSKPGS